MAKQDNNSSNQGQAQQNVVIDTSHIEQKGASKPFENAGNNVKTDTENR